MITFTIGFGIIMPLLLLSAQPTWSAGAIALITVGCLLGSALFFLFLVAINPRPCTIDLVHGVLRTRSRTIPFAAVTRVAAFRVRGPGHNGGDWLTLGTAEKNPVQRASIDWGARGAFGPEQWWALQILVAYSGSPGLEVLRDNGGRRDEPLTVIPREHLLAALEAQRVWTLTASRRRYEDSPFFALVRDAVRAHR